VATTVANEAADLRQRHGRDQPKGARSKEAKMRRFNKQLVSLMSPAIARSITVKSATATPARVKRSKGGTLGTAASGDGEAGGDTPQPTQAEVFVGAA